MKKYLVSALFFGLVSVSAFAGDPAKRVDIVPLWESSTIYTTGTTYSAVVNLNLYRGSEFAVQLTVTGPSQGHVTNLNWTVSNDGKTFVRPLTSTGARASQIANSFGATSGASSDGKEFYTITVPPAQFLRLSAAATVSNMTTTATLATR